MVHINIPGGSVHVHEKLKSNVTHKTVEIVFPEKASFML